MVIGQDDSIDEDVKVNQQFWLDYNFSKSTKENRDLSTQIGYRKITPAVYDRFLGISTLNIKNTSQNKFLSVFESFHLGAGAIYTYNHNENDNFELRLIQGIRFNITTLKLFTFNNYIRLEERLQTSFNNGVTIGYRLRYKLSTAISWKNHLWKFTEGFYFPLEAEVFFNLKKTSRFNDLLRLSPGVGYKSKKGWRFETFLIFNRTKNITETNNTSSDFILRIRIRDERKKKVENSAPVQSVNEDKN